MPALPNTLATKHHAESKLWEKGVQTHLIFTFSPNLLQVVPTLLLDFAIFEHRLASPKVPDNMHSYYGTDIKDGDDQPGYV